MSGYQTFYGDSQYGVSSTYADNIEGSIIGPSVNGSNLSLASDPRTANQLKNVSGLFATGTKNVEVNLALGGPTGDIVDSIPKQQLDEINRLRKLVGAELTVHGILEDPAGMGTQGPWDESKREQAERHMWQSMEKAHQVSPDRNVVVTFHTSNGMPEPEIKSWDPTTGDEKLVNIAVINERTGQVGALPRPKRDILEKDQKKGEIPDPKIELDKENRDAWLQNLSGINRNLTSARSQFRNIFQDIDVVDESDGKYFVKKDISPLQRDTMMQLYEQYVNNDKKYKEILKDIATTQLPKNASVNDIEKRKESLHKDVEDIGQVDIIMRDSYNQFKEAYAIAYENAEKKDNGDVKRLQEIGSKIRDSLDPDKGYLKDRKQLYEFSKALTEGVEVMNSLKEDPKLYTPLMEFGIEKSAETFGNLALKSYKEFKENAPVVSIENPPAGTGIYRAEDMVNMIKQAQDNFVKGATQEGILSKKEAQKQAEKLIGATWDVGHINMLRKYGAKDEHLIEETKKIAPYVKNVHLSDNFGMQHTELPMGMGNVPMQEHLKELQKGHKESLDKVKQVIETGQWYQHFQISPFAETLSAFGSPIYAQGAAPASEGSPGGGWNQVKDVMGDYSLGYGAINPQIHHSLYGAGFSNLPSELGGQVAGAGSRFSGNGME